MNWAVMIVAFLLMIFFMIGAGVAIIDRRKPYLNLFFAVSCAAMFVLSAVNL